MTLLTLVRDAVEDNDAGAVIVAELVGRGHALKTVLAAMTSLGAGPVGNGPEVNVQVDVDDFDFVYSFEDWLEFADGSILDPDGDRVLFPHEIGDAAAEEAAADRDEAILAAHGL